MAAAELLAVGTTAANSSDVVWPYQASAHRPAEYLAGRLRLYNKL